MSQSSFAIYDCNFSELASSENEPEAPITIVYEPHSMLHGSPASGSISTSLKAVPPGKAGHRELATGQGQGVCHLEASGDEFA